MHPRISPLADVDPRAELADDVFVGPFCAVGPHVRIGRGTRLESHVVLTGHTTIGQQNRFFPHTVIGGEPQDYSYSGAPTRLVIGDHNLFREGVTVNRAAEKEDHVTTIGDHNMLMANAHVAHNCCIGNHAILVNGVLLGGHVHIQDHAIVSGNSVVHHFATVGTLAFVSGGCRVPTDIPPFMLASGSDSPQITTINVVGMRRKGISADVITLIKQAHRRLYREHQSLAQCRAQFQSELEGEFPAELTLLLNFVEKQQAGKQGRAGEARRNQPRPVEDAPLRRAA